MRDANLISTKNNTAMFNVQQNRGSWEIVKLKRNLQCVKPFYPPVFHLIKSMTGQIQHIDE